MSWKLYLIVITNAANVNMTEVPAKLGLGNLKPVKEINLLEAQSSHATCIGRYGDKIFIVSEENVFKLFEKNQSDFEKKLITAFRNSEIGALVLNGTVDLYGYAIIKNGERQRIKSGADQEVYIDIGNKLQEEIDIANKGLFTDEEMKIIKEEHPTKKELEKFMNQETSTETTYRLTARYFEKNIEEKGSLVDKIMVTQYE